MIEYKNVPCRGACEQPFKHYWEQTVIKRHQRIARRKRILVEYGIPALVGLAFGLLFFH